MFMQELKDKYERSIIKLGNSKAITFPQEWTKKAKLSEKSEVSLYPIDDKTIVVRAFDDEQTKSILRIDEKWPIELVRDALISAFKLNVNEIYIKYNRENQDEILKLLTEMRGEIIGLDFKEDVVKKEYFVYFLLDTSRKSISDILLELINAFSTIIDNILKGIPKKNKELLLAEIERKYHLGRRILITGLSNYPVSGGYGSFPIIQFLGNRVLLLYIKDFINEAINLQNFSEAIIKKYSDILERIPSLLLNLVNKYDVISIKSISELQQYLQELNEMLEKKDFEEKFEEIEIRNIIRYYLNGLTNFFDIGLTRLIESEIGIL